MFEAWKSEWGEPSEARLREKLEAEGYSVARYEYAPGTYFPDHTHPTPGLRTDAQRAIQFARSAPGVGCALVGMSRIEHLEENLETARIPPLSREEMGKLF